ncbi:MAG: VWA domain-containing protein [Leptospiraceae bacterium]|nr:VWA domain-containing protein [Leptospiraceae bacterium]
MTKKGHQPCSAPECIGTIQVQIQNSDIVPGNWMHFTKSKQNRQANLNGRDHTSGSCGDPAPWPQLQCAWRWLAARRNADWFAHRFRLVIWALAAVTLLAGLGYLEWHPIGTSLRAETGKTAKSPVLFILDASGSMTELFSGVPRMVAARVMLFEQLEKLDADVPVGLVAYGNRIAGCRSARIYGSIRTQNRRDLAEQVKQMHPAGATPIANTLKLIGTNLLPYYPGTTVVLISDGAESCGGDPVREAQKLMQRGYKVKLNVIGLDVDRITAMQLGAIARTGQGQYFDVKNQTDFANAVALSSSSQSATVTNEPTITTDQKPAPTNSDVLLKISKVYPMQDENGQMVWHVTHAFESSQASNYVVVVKALRQPVNPGPGGRIPGDKRLLASQSSLYFQSDSGAGKHVFAMAPIKEALSAGSPLYLQAELWNTSDVPNLIYISEAVLVKP